MLPPNPARLLTLSREKSRALPLAQLYGFTLVEIMVVLVILSLAVGLAVLNLSRDVVGELRQESRALAGALEYAVERAHRQHQVLGLSPLENGAGWQFLLLSADEKPQWVMVSDDVLMPRRLPEDMVYVPTFYAGAKAAPEMVMPILPSGHFEPYELELRLSGSRVKITVDPLGRVALFQPEPM